MATAAPLAREHYGLQQFRGLLAEIRRHYRPQRDWGDIRLGQRYLVGTARMALDAPDLGRYPSILVEDALPKELAEVRDKFVESKAYQLGDPALEDHKADFLTWLFPKAGMSGDDVVAAFRRGAASREVQQAQALGVPAAAAAGEGDGGGWVSRRAAKARGYGRALAARNP